MIAIITARVTNTLIVPKKHNIHALAAVDWGQVELLGTPLSDMTRNDDQLTFLDVEGLSLPF